MMVTTHHSLPKCDDCGERHYPGNREDCIEILLDQISDLKSELKEKEAERTAAPDLSAACKAALEQAGDDPCSYDHHGYCQTHNLAEKGECWYELAKSAIAKAEEGE